jgi:transposase
MIQVIFSRCCGLDIHKKAVVGYVRIYKRGQIKKDIRTFRTVTEDLLLLHDWLKAHGVTHMAMESTGIYWKPVFNLLDESFTVLLVNAAHIKTVPGRKADVKGCKWIADLLSHGLLKESFLPPKPIRDLRHLTRYRKSLIDERVQEVNRLQKLLEMVNIKLASVVSEAMGASGKAMLKAILEGTTDPEALADLARGKLRKKLPLLRGALGGHFRPRHCFLLGQIFSHLEFLDGAIEEVSKEVERHIDPFVEKIEKLKTIPGISQRVTETVIAEIWTNMDQFPIHRYLASRARLCPGNNESAGKRKSGKVRKEDRWLRKSLIEASWAATRSKKSYLSAQHHRLARHRGKKKAVIAVGHSILVMLYHILKYNYPYQELGSDYFNRVNILYMKKHFVKRLEGLGYKVVLEPSVAAA